MALREMASYLAFALCLCYVVTAVNAAEQEVCAFTSDKFTNDGIIETCTFTTDAATTKLDVTYSGAVRTGAPLDKPACSKYDITVTIEGQPCQNPGSNEMLRFANRGDVSQSHCETFEGTCTQSIGAGKEVIVSVNVGSCGLTGGSLALGAARTGLGWASSITIDY